MNARTVAPKRAPSAGSHGGAKNQDRERTAMSKMLLLTVTNSGVNT